MSHAWRCELIWSIHSGAGVVGKGDLAVSLPRHLVLHSCMVSLGKVLLMLIIETVQGFTRTELCMAMVVFHERLHLSDDLSDLAHG